MQQKRAIPESDLKLLNPARREQWTRLEEGISTPRAGVFSSNSVSSIASTLLDQPAWLEACYLYDTQGSHLFEEICKLPEYYLTRTENRILEDHAAEFIEAAPVDCLVELGAGYSVKTRHLLRHQVRQRGRGTYAPVDVNLNALKAAREVVSREFPQLEFSGFHAAYEAGIVDLSPELTSLFIFLGSTLGNLMRMELVSFLEKLTAVMKPGDFLLLGVDRVKDPRILQRAYDDAAGVTRRFILNVLLHVNRLTGSAFRLEDFEYRPFYNQQWQQMEMYLESVRIQRVEFPSLGIFREWRKGDRLLVEVSRKFEPSQLALQLRSYGLEPVQHQTDSREWFSLLLFKKTVGSS